MIAKNPFFSLVTIGAGPAHVKDNLVQFQEISEMSIWGFRNCENFWRFQNCRDVSFRNKSRLTIELLWKTKTFSCRGKLQINFWGKVIYYKQKSSLHISFRKQFNESQRNNPYIYIYTWMLNNRQKSHEIHIIQCNNTTYKCRIAPWYR